MKFAILSLLLLTAAIAAPAELQFLEALLPNSKHVRTSVLKSTPSGIIFSEYVGSDDIPVIKECLQKSLGTEIREVPVIKDEMTFLSAWAIGMGLDQKKHTLVRLQGADLSIDILIYHLNDDATGISSRHVALQIIRKGA
jgi:hypothetical protein